MISNYVSNSEANTVLFWYIFLQVVHRSDFSIPRFFSEELGFLFIWGVFCFLFFKPLNYNNHSSFQGPLLWWGHLQHRDIGVVNIPTEIG